ncbi:hypothetical protein Godav_027328 [Gossypium davidsonii]|uniref:DUF4283 domain-containing protein n=1 Tax=Gossypium davidsonii TaxID=34287 RepID=A0A7J8RVQ2_GOSDV|nr:hypothetical protein [Gossypium davidsonii]
MMEDAMENLNLLDEEEEAFQENKGAVGCVHQLYLVGRCRDSVVPFPSLCNTMADLWHPLGGICITEIGEKRYLFQFFHKVDIDRVVAGIPWFFNNHLLILQTVPVGSNPAFGDFCGKFIECDTSIPTLGIHHYLRIRVCLNIVAPLKRKKKFLVGKAMVVYARFKYEKLSLFYFICGKLGHGESYCPFRLTINPTKIVFGWDLLLRVEGRRRNMAVSRWLREADGSTYSEENLAGVMHGNPLNVGKGLSRNSRGSGGILNPNLIPVGTVQIQGGGRTVKGRTGCMNALNANGEMDLDLDEENKPIKLFDGQKRQRIVESSRVLIEENVGSRSINVSASSDD